MRILGDVIYELETCAHAIAILACEEDNKNFYAYQRVIHYLSNKIIDLIKESQEQDNDSNDEHRGGLTSFRSTHLE